MSAPTLTSMTMNTTAAARRRAARVEDAVFMAETGESLEGAAARLAMAPGALERALYRAGRVDVVRRMRRNFDAATGAGARRGRVLGRAA